MKLIKVLALSAVLSCVLGCSNTVEGAKKDIEVDSENASAKMKEGMDSASNLADNAANKAKEVTSAAGLTLKVKNAINANKELNDSKNLIDVDTDKDYVTLKGHVASQALKDKASEVAKEEMKVNSATQELKNDLTIQ